MALYERLVGRDNSGRPLEHLPSGTTGKIPLHGFGSLLREVARGAVARADAAVAVEVLSGAPLDAGERGQLTALLATMTGNAANMRTRAEEIEDVLMMAEHGAVHDTPAKVTARLNVS